MPRSDGGQNGSSPFSFGSTPTSVPGQNQGVADRGRGTDPFGASTAVPGKDSQAPGSLFSHGRKEKSDPGESYGYRKSILGHQDEVSVYTAQMDAKHSMDKRARVILISTVLVVVLVPLTLILPKGLMGAGGLGLSPAVLAEALSSNIAGVVNWVSGGPVTTGVSILFWQVLTVAIVGAALAMNGCVYQGALKNALASPSTLGVMSGATLGTIFYNLVFGVTETNAAFTVVQASELQAQFDQMDAVSYILSTQGRALCSLLGAFIVVSLILIIAHIAGRGKVSKVGLLIAGQVFAALIMGVISVIRSYIMIYGTPDQQEVIASAVGGSVGSITTPLAFFCLAIPMLIGAIVIMVLRLRLNLLAFGEDEAKSMGLSTMATRNVSIIVCTALTGLVVSFVGSVGFVGFLVPHMARKVVGPDFRYLVPASALFGSIFLLVANYLMSATMLFSGSLGTLTSILGVVFFMVMAIRERSRGNVDWI